MYSCVQTKQDMSVLPESEKCENNDFSIHGQYLACYITMTMMFFYNKYK